MSYILLASAAFIDRDKDSKGLKSVSWRVVLGRLIGCRCVSDEIKAGLKRYWQCVDKSL